jgi:uncharacterized hydrophobic protein (TIGR00271 family)
MLVTVIALSAIVTTITSQFVHLGTTPEILSRSDIHATDVVISILLGVAGDIAMTSNIPGSLVGVAIAASLVPPAAVTGIGLSLLNPKIFTGSLLLELSNVVGLLLGSMIIFIIRGAIPENPRLGQVFCFASFTDFWFIQCNCLQIASHSSIKK